MTNPTDKIVEAVARALARCENEKQLEDGTAWPIDFEGKGMDYDWESYISDARAATLAHTQALMENVTPEMMDAGQERDENGNAGNANDVFDAMLSTHMEQMKCKP